MVGTREDVDVLGATVAVDGDAVGSAETVALDAPSSAGMAAFSATRALSGVPESTGEIDLRPFGPYTRVETIGEQGSMGIVARGFNEAFDRWELLKFLRSDHALDPARVRQFHREGRVLAKLSHPNVVQVFAIYQMEGRPCLAMEYLHGSSLAKLIREQPEHHLPIDRWLALFLDAARGLSAAHQVGLLHRDLKPDNLVVLEDKNGEPTSLKLIDFGLATADQTRQREEPRSSLVADLSGGTPVYMAPELWTGEVATPRTDIFALGLTFTYAAVGCLPFHATTVLEAFQAIAEPTPFPDPRDARPDLPRRLADVLRKATAKPSEQRFATVDDLIAALLAAAGHARARRVPGSGPYRGLQAFSHHERDVFFGREEESAEVVEKVRLHAGVVVVGASGSGKSSLLEAGVIPAILDGALGGSLAYRPLVVLPSRRPLQAIAAAVATATNASEQEVRTFLQRTPQGLGAALRDSLQEGEGYLVVVDPLEALAGDDVDPAETRAACDAIASVLEPVRPELRLLASVRADRMDRLFAVESLRPWLVRGFHPIRPLRGDQLRSVLIEPARAAGFELESQAVVDEILEEAEGLEAGLPLVSFAMQAWWSMRDEPRRILPSRAWRELGGVAGALVRNAESVVASLDRDLRAAVEATLLRLVREDGSRRRVSRQELVDPASGLPHVADALDVLLQARIVQENFDQVEIVHDALIGRWPRLAALREFLGEDRAMRERLTAAAGVWESQGRVDGALWTGEQATQLARWIASTKSTLTQGELSFAEAVQRRLARRRLLIRSIGVCAAIVAIGFVVVAKSNERAMAATLEGAVLERDRAHEAFRKAEASRLRLLAETRLEDHPEEALRLAAQSYDLESHPAVDTVAYRAHARGIARPVPSPEGGASIVRFSDPGSWIALGGLSGRVELLASTNENRASVEVRGESVGTVSSLAFSKDEKRIAVGTSAGWVGSGAIVDRTFEGRRVCHGITRALAWSGDHILAQCQGEDGTYAIHRGDGTVVEGGLVPAALRGLPHPLVRQDGSVAWFDGSSREDAKGLRVDGAALTWADADPGTRRVVVGDREGRVWLANGAGKPLVIAQHDAAVHRVRLASEGNVVLSLDVNGNAKLTTERGVSLRAAGGAREAFAWVPGRGAVVVALDGGDIEVWSTRTGEVLAELAGEGGAVLGLDADAGGRWLVGTTLRGARAFALEEAAWRAERGPSATAPERCAVSPDGSRVACAWGDRVDVERIDGSVGEAHRSVERRERDAVLALAVTSDGKQVAWSTAKDAWVEGRKEGEGVSWIGHGAAGKLVSGREHASVLKVVVEGKVEATLANGRLLAVARDGRWLARVDAHDVVMRGGVRRRWEGLGAQDLVVAGTWADDGLSFAVATDRGRVGIASEERDVEEVGRVRGSVTCLAFSQSGRVVLAASSLGSVVAFDTQSKSVIVERVVDSPVQACGRSAVEDRFVVVSRDGSLRMRWFDLAPMATRDLAGVGDGASTRWVGLPTERAW